LGKVAREFIGATKKGDIKKLPEKTGDQPSRSARWYGENK
jgi:hypothetical protein